MVKDKASTPDKIKYNAKLQIQKYIESFFSGNNRQYMGVASPGFVNYDISKSTIGSSNVKDKKLQVARYFNELKNYLPAVLILDGGMKNIPQSFNNITNSFGNLAEPEYEISPTRELDIGILVGSNDVQTTDDLVTAISLMFNDFRTIAGGNLIAGDINKGESWAIILPISGISFGSIQEQAINGDAVDKIHYCEASISIFYEDKIRFVNSSKNLNIKSSSSKLIPKLVTPSTLGINEQLQVQIENYNPELRVTISDYKIATLNPKGLLTPRSIGDVIIRVINKRDEVVSEKTLSII